MRMIFVGGCERSGTSLVQKILASHSRIAGGPELVFTGHIAELYRQMAADYPEPYGIRLERFYRREELTEIFRGLFEDLFRRLRDANPEALYLSEKTPSNIYAAEPLLEIFPDARFVHILRDGRDVLASHRDVQRRFEAAGAPYHRANFRLHRICRRWNHAVDAHFRLAAHPRLQGRYFSLRYEELVRRPQEVLTELFGWLNLDLEPLALAPETLDPADLGIPVDGYWTTEETAQMPFDPGRIGRWRHTLPMASKALCMLLMGERLQRLEYPVGKGSAGVSRWVGRLERRGARRGAQTFRQAR